MIIFPRSRKPLAQLTSQNYPSSTVCGCLLNIFAAIAGIHPQSPCHFERQPHRESHKAYGPPTWGKYLQLQLKQTHTGTSTAPIAETHWSKPNDHAHSPELWHQHRLANVTCPEVKDFVELILLYHPNVQTVFSMHTLRKHCSAITLVNTQNVSVTKIVDSSSIQCAESKYGLRIQFLALVVMIHEVWLNA